METTTPITDRTQRIVQLAKQHRLVSDGELEVDDNATISEGDDNGAYVQAWLWVDFSGTELNKNLDDEEE